MSPLELLETLRRSGAEVIAEGERLRVQAPRGVLTEEIRRALAEQKVQLLAELSIASAWPPECLEAKRRFGVAHARLFPLLCRRVATPDGIGELVQVFADRAAVRLDRDPGALAYFLPAEIHPSGAGAHSDLDTSGTRIH